MKRNVLVAVGVVAVVGVFAWRPAKAGVTSLWADDATLVKQLSELMKINDELSLISDGIKTTADATHNSLQLYLDTRAAIDELQSYSVGEFWSDFKRDVYNHYPGFEVLEADNQIEAWKRLRGRSPFKTYEAISAVFGDLSEPLRKASREGRIDTKALEIQRFEAAGAFSLSEDANESTKEFDKDTAELLRLATSARSGQEAQIVSAKAAALQAAQNSHIIRLLSRRLRFDGIRSAMDYGERVKAYKQQAELAAGLRKSLDKAATPPKMMRFESLW